MKISNPTSFATGGAPDALTPGQAGTNGIGTSAARSDHAHGMADGAPVTQAFGDVAATGSGVAVADHDHRHGMPANPYAVFVKTNESQVRNNSAVLVTDNALIVPIAANETLDVEFVLYVTTPGGAGFDAAVDVPAAVVSTAAIALAVQGGPDGSNHAYSVADAGLLQPLISGSTTTDGVIVINCHVVNGANAGSVSLQWAQNTPTVGDTRVKVGSVARRWRP